MKFDVIVVGAGPSGSTAAKNLASQGIKVLIVDKEKFPRNKPCGGGLPLRTLERYPYIKELDVIENYSYGGSLHSPSLKNFVEIKKQEPVIAMVQRKQFDKALVDLAVEKGAVFKDNKKVKDIDIKLYETQVTFSDGTNTTTDLVIGADGFISTVAKKTGLLTNHKYFGVCVLEELPLSPDIITNYYTEHHFCHIYSKYGGIKGYGWIFPKKNVINVGIVSYKLKKFDEKEKKNIKNIFNEYLTYLKKSQILPSDVKSSHLKGGLLPVEPLHKTYAERTLLCGDAAGLINPVSGEGIYYALVSGELAGNTAAEAIQNHDTSERFLSIYQKRWNQEFGKEIKLFSRSKNQWGKEGDRLINLMKKDTNFAELIYSIMMGKKSAYELRWKLVKHYLQANLHLIR